MLEDSCSAVAPTSPRSLAPASDGVATSAAAVFAGTSLRSAGIAPALSTVGIGSGSVVLLASVTAAATGAAAAATAAAAIDAAVAAAVAASAVADADVASAAGRGRTRCGRGIVLCARCCPHTVRTNMGCTMSML